MSNLAILVDENDNELGFKDRNKLKKGDIHRIVSLWIENSEGEILLAQRSYTKSNDPGVWGPAVAGTVEPGDDYDSTVLREAYEEIGLTGIMPEKLDTRFYMRTDGTGRFIGLYKAIVDWPIEKFVIQTEEVEQVKWFKKEELLKMLELNPEKFTPTKLAWEYYLSL